MELRSKCLFASAMFWWTSLTAHSMEGNEIDKSERQLNSSNVAVAKLDANVGAEQDLQEMSNNECPVLSAEKIIEEARNAVSCMYHYKPMTRKERDFIFAYIARLDKIAKQCAELQRKPFMFWRYSTKKVLEEIERRNKIPVILCRIRSERQQLYKLLQIRC